MISTVFQILVDYHTAFAGGLIVTLQLCAIIWTAGLIFGTALGVIATRIPRWVGAPCRFISFFLGAVPLLVFMFWLHYPVQAMFGVVIDPFITACFTLSILNIFGVADLVRSSLDDFPKQYVTAAQVTGLTRTQTIMSIQLPLIFRSILPGLLILQVSMLHATLFTSMISVEELFRVAQRINAQIYKPIEIYTALGVFFLAICLPINAFALWFKNKYTRNISER
jgi:polar amino acid transport system permease protein